MQDVRTALKCNSCNVFLTLASIFLFFFFFLRTTSLSDFCRRAKQTHTDSSTPIPTNFHAHMRAFPSLQDSSAIRIKREGRLWVLGFGLHFDAAINELSLLMPPRPLWKKERPRHWTPLGLRTLAINQSIINCPQKGENGLRIRSVSHEWELLPQADGPNPRALSCDY